MGQSHRWCVERQRMRPEKYPCGIHRSDGPERAKAFPPTEGTSWAVSEVRRLGGRESFPGTGKYSVSRWGRCYTVQTPVRTH